MNKTKPLVSVIVPIYNVEKYLWQCLESISKQTLQELEIICINDGSTDTSPQILAQYADIDNRITIINKKNTGYGHSVNLGIEKAQGEYLAILESDDWIEPSMYEKMYHTAVKTQADIVKCDFYIYDSFAKITSIPYPHGPAELKNIYPEGQSFQVVDAPLILTYHSSVWASLYRSDFIKQIKFIEDAGASYQDFPFMFNALINANKIALSYERLLHYRMEACQNSSTKRPGRGALKMIDRILSVKNMLQEKSLLDKYAEEFYFHATKCTCGFFSNIQDEVKPDFYTGMLQVYQNFPTNFTYKYFDSSLKSFLLLVLEKNEKILLGNPYTPQQSKIKLLVKKLPLPIQSFIRHIYKGIKG